MTVTENGVSYTTDYSYDKNNQLTNILSSYSDHKEGQNIYYDANGNQTDVVKYNTYNTPQFGISVGLKSEAEVSDLYEKYEYNEKNQLVSAYVKGKNSTYEYRSDGLRYSKTVSGTTTIYGLIGDSVAFEHTNTVLQKQAI